MTTISKLPPLTESQISSMNNAQAEINKEIFESLNLTEKQKAIQQTLFKDKGINVNKFFTINVYKSYTTNAGEKAYYRNDTDCSVYTENALMTAIYTGKYREGLIWFIACKRKPTKNV